MKEDMENSARGSNVEVLRKGNGPLSKRLNYILTISGLMSFILILVAVCLQLLTRWILSPYFGINIPWTGALAQLFLVWLTLIGAAIASRDNDHIQIAFFIDKLSERVRGVVQLVISALTVLFLTVFIYGSGGQYFATAGRQFHTLPIRPPFTREWFYAFAIVAGSLMILYAVRDMIVEWQGGED